MPEPRQTPGLVRVLGAWSAVAVVVGTVIGSGIFLVPKAMTEKVGCVPAVFAVWVVGGLLSLFGALSYAELAGAMPRAGGEYVYLGEAYGPLWGFLYGWSLTFVAKSGSVATLATAFFYYLANFCPKLEQPFYKVHLPIGPEGGPLEIRYGQVLAVGVIGLLALVNYLGVRLGGGVQVTVTLVKVGLLAAIIAIGLGSGRGSLANYHSTVPAIGGLTGFFAALVAALWAYDGWNNLGMLASEIKQPQRNLPLALTLGTAAVMVIYLAANAAYFYILPASAVASSNRVAAEMMRRVLGEHGASAVSIAAMVSIFAALNGSILSATRVPYAMACDGFFFRAVGYVHPKRHTPAVSILLLGVWASLLVFSGRYEQLFTYVIFASWIFYGMTAAAVVVLRRKRPDLYRPYRTIGYPIVPILFVLGASGVVVSTLLNSPRESLLGLVLILGGLPFFRYWQGQKK
jgi:APA family basic amino acid/polyamine antiporter